LECIYLLKIPLRATLQPETSEIDFFLLELAVRFLKPLTEARKILSKTVYVCISMVPQVIVTLRTILKTFIEINEMDSNHKVADKVLDIFKSMLRELVQPWGKGLNPVKELPMEIALAQALDPRTRFFLDNYEQSDQQEIWLGVKKSAGRLTMEDMERQDAIKRGIISFFNFGGENLPANESNSLKHETLENSGEKSNSITFQALWHDMQAKRSSENQSQGGVPKQSGQLTDSMLMHILEVEIAKFVAIPCISENDDPILWWKQHHRMFPNLAELARTLLCVPAMSFSSKNGESDRSRYQRERLTGDDVPTIVFLHGSWEAAQRFAPAKNNSD